MITYRLLTAKTILRRQTHKKRSGQYSSRRLSASSTVTTIQFKEAVWLKRATCSWDLVARQLKLQVLLKIRSGQLQSIGITKATSWQLHAQLKLVVWALFQTTPTLSFQNTCCLMVRRSLNFETLGANPNGREHTETPIHSGQLTPLTPQTLAFWIRTMELSSWLSRISRFNSLR